MGKAGFWDKAKDIGWNVATAAPGIGTGVALMGVGADLLNGMMDEDGTAAGHKKAEQDKRDAKADLISAIPLVGTIDSYAGIGYDIVSSDDTWGNLTNQALGGEDKYNPPPPPAPKPWFPSDLMNDPD